MIIYAVVRVNHGKRKLSPLTECVVTSGSCYASSNIIEHFHHTSVITHMITVTVKHKAISIHIVTEPNLTSVYANKILLIRDNSSASSYPISSITKSATCHSWQQSAFLFLLKKYSCSLFRFPSAPGLAIDEEEKTEREREKATSTSKRHIQ